VKTLARRAILLAVAACCLGGCWRGRLLVCAEPPFWASLGEPLPVRISVAWQSLRHGWWPDFLLVGPQENPRDRLSAALAARRYGAAVVGPMLSFEAAGFAQGFPHTRFILVDGTAAGAAAQGSVLLSFDRTSAFQAAGEAVRSSLAAAAPHGLVGVLVPVGAASTDAEAQAFLRGASGEGAAAPVVREIDLPVDAAKVKAAVSEMRGRGVEVFLPRLGSLTVACLESLRESGGSAVLDDWAASGAFAQQVFLSIEEDVPAGIGLCLGRTAGPGSVVQGPVRIVSGNARPLPREWKGRVDRR
jgi:hypothetical protein